MAVLKAVHSKAKLSVAINYITKKEKTAERLISGVHCDPLSAVLEMENTKNIWHKTKGRQYDHYIQSFAPGERVTPEQAHAIALRWASGEFFGFECLVATHVDRNHIHSHIIVNSVNYQTGKKLHTSARWLKEAKEFSDNLCREQGLSICEKGKTFDGQERTDATSWSKDQYQLLEKASRGEVKSFLLEIAVAVCMVLKCAISRKDFKKRLLDYGIDTTWTDKRKYITFADLDGNKVRNKKLSEVFHVDFSKEGIEHEFEQHSREADERERAAVPASHQRGSAERSPAPEPAKSERDRLFDSGRFVRYEDSEPADTESSKRVPDAPESIRQRLRQAAETARQTGKQSRRGEEEYLSFDQLLAEGKRESEPYHAGYSPSRQKRHRGMEL